MANWAKLQEQLTGLPVAKRAKHAIHFQNSDGSITANFSGKPCHYFEGGLWKPIDTTPLLGGDGKWHIWQHTSTGNGATYGAQSPHIDLNKANPDTFNELVTSGSYTPPVIPPVGEVKTKTVEIRRVAIPTLRMRAGAGTSYAVVGTLPQGREVEILEVKAVGADTWVRVGQGQWCAMKYNGANYIV